ncbi:MAG: 23S rRNA (pseudouridine(1915)-N(3))-methyltransferase RlmH [bacterium]|nr:23S rRNA (pseudouridine(1915)-N(3))-methyltransferase RlmH [bacterium]
MIKIICVGKQKENYLKQAQSEYEKRLSKYTKLQVIELKDYKDDNIKQALKKEKEQIIKHLKETDNIIILDLNGKQFTSEEFAENLNKELIKNSNITFLIGSSNGLDEEIKNLSTKKISFSPLTFPHGLFRIILLEQIYRSFKILNNESYHK